MKRILILMTLCALPAACSSDPEKTYPVQVMRGKEQAQKQVSQVEMQIVTKALELFRFDQGRYPTTEEGLQALIKDPGSLRGWHKYLPHRKAIQGMDYQSDGKTFRLTPSA